MFSSVLYLPNGRPQQKFSHFKAIGHEEGSHHGEGLSPPLNQLAETFASDHKKEEVPIRRKK